MTYAVHVNGLGEVCRVPSAYFTEAHKFFNAYAKAGYAVILLRDGLVLRAFAS